MKTYTNRFYSISAGVVGLLCALAHYSYNHKAIIGLIPLFPSVRNKSDWGYTYDKLYNDESNLLIGQSAFITGANSGIGYEISLVLARLGCSKVTMACRNITKCDDAADEIRYDDQVVNIMKKYNTNVKIETIIIDTSSLQSVKDAAMIYKQDNDSLNMLFLNAGIATGGHNHTHGWYAPLSKDGIEIVFATNVVGHHLLYRHFEPLLLESSPSSSSISNSNNNNIARVVLTSSSASFVAYKSRVPTNLQTINAANPRTLYPYGHSKLAQIVWSKAITRRLGNTSTIYVNSAHPGAVYTRIWDNQPFIPSMFRLRETFMIFMNFVRRNIMWTANDGALTLIYLGVAIEDLINNNIRGKYFHPQVQEVINPFALDVNLQDKLWQFCDELVKDFI